MTKSLMVSLVLFASAFVLSSCVIAEDLQYFEKLKRERQRTDEEQMQKLQEAQDAERDEQEKKALIEYEERERAFKEQERQEREQKDREEEADAKAMSDYLATRTKELVREKGLVVFKPGSKLCNFPEHGRSYLLVEDVDKNKIHTVTEYGYPLIRPTHKIVIRKHPKFDGKLEIEFLKHGLRMLELNELKTVRVATERCRF